MDVRLTSTQIGAVYESARVLNLNGGNPIYTKLNSGIHFSWQMVSGRKTLVVGEDGPPKRHKHFICTITKELAVTLTADIGYIPLPSINTTMLKDKVTATLKLQLKKLITGSAAFNNGGRTGQGLTFHDNRIVNRHERRSVLFGTANVDYTIKPGGDRTMANETSRGFAVYQTDGPTDCFYRNYDFRENIDLDGDEPLRILHMDDGSMKLLRTNDREIRLVLLE